MLQQSASLRRRRLCTANELQLQWHRADLRPNNRAELCLEMLGRMRGVKSANGSDVFDHSVHAAQLAEEVACDHVDDVVVSALMHDVGELDRPDDHGAVAAELLAPWLEPRACWVLRHHHCWQGYYYHHDGALNSGNGRVFRRFGEESTLMRLARHELEVRADKGCVNAAVQFAAHIDRPAFGERKSETDARRFLPALRRVFNRPVFWHERSRLDGGVSPNVIAPA